MGFFDFLFGNNNGSNDNAGKNAQQSKTSTSSNGMMGNKPTSKSTTPSPSATSKPKKTLTSYSMEDIYGKGFRFVVDRYEEWANQRCTSQGELNGEIVAEVRGSKIVFTITGADRLNIVKTPSMDLSNPQSQILRSNGSPLIKSDRIQYLANNISGENDPYVCHLFYENGRISYVRFGFMDPNSSSLFPMVTRIYEFYGDMIELSDTPKARTSSNEFSPFVFKSSCHQRYQNIMPVMGLQQCLRTVSVEKNINGCSGYDIKPGDGYIVKVFNNDMGKPNMSDKPMRVKSISKDLVVLQGYPLRAMSPFGWMDVDYADYGLEVHYRNGEIEKCVLHMYDRDTYIEYRR